MMSRFLPQCAVIAFLAPIIAGAQTKQPSPPGKPQKVAEDRPPVVQLRIDPAGKPMPALKYQLLPRSLGQTAGNAAPYYYRSFLTFAASDEKVRKQYNDNINKWLEEPLDKLPQKEAHKLLSGFWYALGEIEIAASRETCDWNLRFEDLKGYDVLSFRMPEFQQSRNLMRLLSLKARLEIADGDFESAVRTLQIGYRLSRDVARAPTLINALVGVTGAQMMNEVVEVFIGQTGSPNLYWALTGLPRPLIDMRRAIEFEKWLPQRIFPLLNDVETAERSPEEWRRLLMQMALQLIYDEIFQDSEEVKLSLQRQCRIVMLVAKAYPDAKRALIDHGYTREQVEAMPVAQVVDIHQSRVARYIFDEVFKCTFFPYSQTQEQFDRAEVKLKKEGYWGPRGSTREAIPIAATLMPALSHVVHREAWVEQRIAALRTIEALRMHAAANRGQFPKTLEEITIVPVPDDPLTEKPFPYRIEGNKAVLEAPAPRGQSQQSYGRVYEITLNRRER